MFEQLGLYTDFYELTMAQGYFLNGWSRKRASFDYFFRSLPFNGGYLVFAGLSDVLTYLEKFSFSKNDLQYLKEKKFDREFLKYLQEFRFKGDILSVKEGEIVFPNEILMRIEGNIIETQLMETLLLNIINFESLIATKASRIILAAKGRKVVDFGLRRAQGFGGYHASKAAIIGGIETTSNVIAAKDFGLTPSGTQAHSWIESFGDELSAFRKYAELYPGNCILLVDTYNTLNSGIPNAIKIAKELEARGDRLLGIRLDSGDLAYLSKRARQILDQAGLDYVQIAVSNQLDEHIIRSLLDQGAPIDAFGVGTNLITGKDDAALDGVYKLSYFDKTDRMKISDNLEKTLFPGKKKVIRYFDNAGSFYADAMTMDEEINPGIMIHPFFPEKKLSLKGLKKEEILFPVVKKGKPKKQADDIADTISYSKSRMSSLPDEHKRFENPHIFKVGVSKKLFTRRNTLMKEIKMKFAKEEVK